MDNYVENLKKIKELAGEIRVLNLLEPSSHTVSIMAEIIERCKHIPELEMIDNSFINNFEAEA